ncbi:D-Ala-D-Ala carboxypeptidase family metallohydrolase [Undibacterium sp. TJN19]|uniref:D-Ala-D-Ala carboxypeptidase family metallohydrolase n=1 Tax=Undibacterium sp. TJN19 TaxID=3413055 RepID=UPI003BF3B901
MNITPHFSLDGMIFSQTAVRMGLSNAPSPEVLKNLTRLCETLEKFRAHLGMPINVSSGYRCPEVNKAVGGSINSAHTKGLAADITVTGIAPRSLAAIFVASGIEFDQIIQEGTWLHVGLSDGPARREVLTAHFAAGKAVTYTKGL